MKYKFRNNEVIYENKTSGVQYFLYHNFFGRIVLKILILPIISKMIGKYMDSKLSKRKIKKFIIKNKINLNEYEDVEFKSFNQFFSRIIKDGKRTIECNENYLISPADSRLSVYRLTKERTFDIKGSTFNLEELIKDKELASEFIDGYILIFRLAVDDYHRYCYIDSGYKGKNTFIKGKLHTVNPIVIGKHNIYKENAREYSILNTDHFGKCIFISVGAMMVGKIVNHHEEYCFQKGEEMGFFEFGGSTVCLIIKDLVQIDEDILINSLNGIETKVKYGEKIAVRI